MTKRNDKRLIVGLDIGTSKISAIVAVAILAVLMPIIMELIKPAGGEPAKAAGGLLGSQVNNLKIPSKVQATWTNGDPLHAGNLAGQTNSLAAEQVCVLGGDFMNDQSFTDLGKPGEMFQYIGASDRKTKILVICDNATTLAGEVETYNYSWASQLSNCGCISAGSQNTCCIVAAVYNN